MDGMNEVNIVLLRGHGYVSAASLLSGTSVVCAPTDVIKPRTRRAGFAKVADSFTNNVMYKFRQVPLKRLLSSIRFRDIAGDANQSGQLPVCRLISRGSIASHRHPLPCVLEARPSWNLHLSCRWIVHSPAERWNFQHHCCTHMQPKHERN